MNDFRDNDDDDDDDFDVNCDADDEYGDVAHRMLEESNLLNTTQVLGKVERQLTACIKQFKNELSAFNIYKKNLVFIETHTFAVFGIPSSTS